MTGAQRQLAEIATLWNLIEARAKEVEQFREEAITAAINEMRYAGRRIIDAIVILNGNGWELTDEVKDQFTIAKNYLTNADHDLTDAVCLFARRRFNRVIEIHGLEKLRACCPEFDALYPEILAADRIVQGSREDRQSRNAEYEKLRAEYLPKIIALHGKIRGNIQLRLDDDLPQQISLLQKYVTAVGWIAVVGSLASVIGLGLAIYALL
jgi:hypothetical protein